MITEKPWGYYIDITRTPNLVEKIICVKKGEEISWQSHQHRSEIWQILRGIGVFRVANSVDSPSTYIKVYPGDKLEIDRGRLHQIIADKEDILFFETQIGLCSEEDIQRFQDKYKR